VSSPEAWLKATIETAGSCTAWPLVPAEGTAPTFVVYARDSTAREIQTSGLTGFCDGDFTVDVYADGYTLVRAAADAIRAALHNFTGSGSGATIDHVHVTDEKDGTPVFLEGRDVPTFVVEMNISIRWQE
jgi:hypothetical protein